MGSVKTPAEMITPEEMAPRCGISPESIRMALRKGAFPVGFALQMESGQWRYYIPRAEFEDWIAGRIPSNQRLFAETLAAKVAEFLQMQPNGLEAARI